MGPSSPSDPEGLELQENQSFHHLQQPSSPRLVHGLAWILVVVGILSSILLYSLDNTIVADIIPAIVNDFQSIDNVGWLSVGFVIGGVAVIMPLGKVYGLLNAKYLYIGSVTLFLAASALCGAAPTIQAEIIGRVFAGAGGIGLYIGVMTLLSVNTSDLERPTYLSLVGLTWGIGTVLGPVVGGALETATWRWAFYINLIIGGIFTPVYLFLLPSFDPRPGKPISQRFGRFDFLGAVFSIAALVTLVMPINFGGTLYAWSSGQTIALFVVSGILFIVLAVQQSYSLMTTPTNRMFPVHFLRNKEAVLLFILAAACNASAFVPIYYIPIYFQFTRGDSALESAVRLLPLIFFLSATILLNGFLMSRFGYYQPWYAIGAALALIPTVFLSRINSTTPTANIYGFEVLLGIGAGAFIQAGYAVIQAVVDASDMSNAISFMMIAQIGGITLGLAISSAAFINGAQSDLQTLLPHTPLSQIQQAISGTNNTFLASLLPAVREQVLMAVVNNMRKVFIPAYVAAAVALVGSVFLRRKRVFLPTAAGA